MLILFRAANQATKENTTAIRANTEVLKANIEDLLACVKNNHCADKLSQRQKVEQWIEKAARLSSYDETTYQGTSSDSEDIAVIAESPLCQCEEGLEQLTGKPDYDFANFAESELLNTATSPNEPSGVKGDAGNSKTSLTLPPLATPTSARPHKANPPAFGFADTIGDILPRIPVPLASDGRKRWLEAVMSPKPNEILAFRRKLALLQFVDRSPRSTHFAEEPMSNCQLALFEPTRVSLHDKPLYPWRVVVTTDHEAANPRCMQKRLWFMEPIVCWPSKDDGTVLSLEVSTPHIQGTLIMTFQRENDQHKLHSLITGTARRSGEGIKPFRLSGYEIVRNKRGWPSLDTAPVESWGDLWVISNPGGAPDNSKTNFRVVIAARDKSLHIHDRIEIRKGDIHARLCVTKGSSCDIYLRRHPQENLTFTAAPSQLSKELTNTLRVLNQESTIVRLRFGKLEDLHNFQHTVADHEVIFDGSVVSFVMESQRSTTTHQRQELGPARIQLVKTDYLASMLIFFSPDTYNLGYMSFTIRPILTTNHAVGVVTIEDTHAQLPNVPIRTSSRSDDFAPVKLLDASGATAKITMRFDDQSSEFMNFPTKKVGLLTDATESAELGDYLARFCGDN